MIENKMQSQNRFFIITVFFIGILVIFFLLSKNPIRQDTILAVDTAKVAQNPQGYFDRHIRLRGFVKPTSLIRFTNQATFEIEQNGLVIPVYFNGSTVLPDTFTDGAAVRAEGLLRSTDGVFEASVIEAKCTSKYQVKDDRSYESSPL